METMTEPGVFIPEETAKLLLSFLVQSLETKETIVDAMTGGSRRNVQMAFSKLATGLSNLQKKDIIVKYMNNVLLRDCSLVTNHTREKILNFISGSYMSTSRQVERIVLHRFIDPVNMMMSTIYFEMDPKERTWRRYMKTRSFEYEVSKILSEIEARTTITTGICRRHTNFSRMMDSNLDRYIIVRNPKRSFCKSDMQQLFIKRCGFTQVVSENINVIHNPMLPAIAAIGFSCPVIDDEDEMDDGEVDDIPTNYCMLRLSTIRSRLLEQFAGKDVLQPSPANRNDVRYFMKVMKGMDEQARINEEAFAHPYGAIKAFVRTNKHMHHQAQVRLKRAENRILDPIEHIYVIDFDCAIAMASDDFECVIPVEMSVVRLNVAQKKMESAFTKILIPNIPKDREEIAKYTETNIHGIPNQGSSHWLDIWDQFLKFVHVDSYDDAKNCIFVSQNAGAANACLRWFKRTHTDHSNEVRRTTSYDDVGDIWFPFYFDHVVESDIVFDLDTFFNLFPKYPLNREQIILAKLQMAKHYKPDILASRCMIHRDTEKRKFEWYVLSYNCICSFDLNFHILTVVSLFQSIQCHATCIFSCLSDQGLPD